MLSEKAKKRSKIDFSSIKDCSRGRAVKSELGIDISTLENQPNRETVILSAVACSGYRPASYSSSLGPPSVRDQSELFSLATLLLAFFSVLFRGVLIFFCSFTSLANAKEKASK